MWICWFGAERMVDASRSANAHVPWNFRGCGTPKWGSEQLDQSTSIALGGNG